MRILLYGAGALGCVYGGRLAQVADVTLLDPNKEHMDAVKEKGLHLDVPEGGTIVTHPKVMYGPEEGVEFDLVLVLVKSYLTAQVAPSAVKMAGSKGYVMTLQNGMGNAEALAAVAGDDRVIAGITPIGAVYLGPGRVRQSGPGLTRFGPWGKGVPSELLHQIKDLMEKAGLPAEVVDNPRKVIWEKLFFNSAVNPTTALIGVEVGKVLTDENLKQAARILVEEAVMVANAEGFNFDVEKEFEHVLKICQDIATHRITMLQDLAHRRKTEIDTINGQVAERGKKYGVRAGAHELITQLIHVMEKGYERVEIK